MTTIIESLGVTLGADISEFKKKFQEAQEASAELNKRVNDTGRVITEVGAKMTASSAIVIAGLAAMNGGFEGHTKALAKIAGSVQGVTLVTGNMMQGFAKTREALAEYRKVQEQVASGAADSRQKLLALTGAGASVVSMMGMAFTAGYALGDAFNKLTGASDKLGVALYKVFLRNKEQEEELTKTSDLWLQIQERKRRMSDEELMEMAENIGDAVKLLMRYRGYSREAAEQMYRDWEVNGSKTVAFLKWMADQAEDITNEFSSRTIRKVAEQEFAIMLGSLNARVASFEAYRRLAMNGESDVTAWLAVEMAHRVKLVNSYVDGWAKAYSGMLEKLSPEEHEQKIREQMRDRLREMEEQLLAEYKLRVEAAEKHRQLVEKETKFVTDAFTKQMKAQRAAAQEFASEIRSAFAELQQLEAELTKLADKQRGTADTLEQARYGLKKKLMSPDEAYRSDEDRAYELLAKAEVATASGQHEMARQYTEKAMAIFESLASEIQDAEGNILVSMEEAVAAAQAGLDAVEATYAQIAASEEQSLRNQIDKQKELIGELKKELQSLLFDMLGKTYSLKLDTEEAKAAIASLRDQLKEFVSDILKHAMPPEAQNPEKHAYGGWVGGTRVGDSTPAMLTPGEFVVNADAAKTYAPMLEALNGMRAPVASGGGGTTTVNIQVSEALTREYIRDVLAPEINRSISRQRIRRFN